MDAGKRAPGRAFCPKCGQKYAVPEEELKRHPGLRFRANCRQCSTPFSVRWQDDGLITDIEELVGGSGGRDVLPKGTRVGKYEIEQMLASGGSSTVYRAFEMGANRAVALKVLHRAPDSDYGVRFRREVEVQGNLKHPNLMPIFDQGVIDKKPYYTMELLHKPTTLETIVALFRGGRLAYNPSLRQFDNLESLLRQVILPVVRAVDFSNSNGVIHRDLKPSNVIVDARTLHVYVIDFGICHLTKKAGGHRLVLRGAEERPDDKPDDKKVRAMGTVRFMPPEQARGEVAEQGDIWQLGALVHYLLAGDSPIAPAIDLNRVGLEKRIANLRKIAESSREAGDDEEARGYEHRIEDLKSGSMRTPKDVLKDAQNARYRPVPPGTDPALAAIVTHAMHPDPRHRYKSAAAFGDDIRRFLEGAPVRAYVAALSAGKGSLYKARLLFTRNRTLVLAVAAALLLAVGIGVFMMLKSAADRRDRIDAWMTEARDSTDPSIGEDRLTRILALQPDHRQAQDLLSVTRRFIPLKEKFESAQEVRRKVGSLRANKQYDAAVELAEDTAAVLEGSVLPDLRRLPQEYPGRNLIPAARELANYLRGRRILTLTGIPGGVKVSLVPPRSRSNTTLQWDRARDWGTAPLASADRPLESGSYVLVFSRSDEQAVYAPFRISHNTARRVQLQCPLDPARVPPGMIYVGAVKGMTFGDLRFTEETRRIDVNAFFLDRREVTNEQYARYVAALPPDRRRGSVPRRLLPGLAEETDPLWSESEGSWTCPEGTRLHPVRSISYLDAAGYARWAGKRLARPEEWELAARGIDGRDYPFGVHLDRAACNAQTGQVASVMDFPRDRSPYGAFGMGGNVAEWTSATAGETTLVKGGSFDLPRYRVIVTSFGRRSADRPFADVGIRCAKDVE